MLNEGIAREDVFMYNGTWLLHATYDRCVLFVRYNDWQADCLEITREKTRPCPLYAR
jgi:hypothetical protein